MGHGWVPGWTMAGRWGGRGPVPLRPCTAPAHPGVPYRTMHVGYTTDPPCRTGHSRSMPGTGLATPSPPFVNTSLATIPACEVSDVRCPTANNNDAVYRRVRPEGKPVRHRSYTVVHVLYRVVRHHTRLYPYLQPSNVAELPVTCNPWSN